MSSVQTCSRLVGEEKEKGEGSSSHQEQASREHPDQRRERAPSEEQGPPSPSLYTSTGGCFLLAHVISRRGEFQKS
jgi:hypothetical protein